MEVSFCEAAIREWHLAQAAVPTNSFKLEGSRRGHQPGSARWSSVESCARTETLGSAMQESRRVSLVTARGKCLLTEVVRIVVRIKGRARPIVFMEGLRQSIPRGRNVTR